jgi:hypothetical protein
LLWKSNQCFFLVEQARGRARVLALLPACSLAYPACKLRVPHYIVICGLAFLNQVFRHYLKAARFSEKFVEYKMCVFVLSTIFI